MPTSAIGFSAPGAGIFNPRSVAGVPDRAAALVVANKLVMTAGDLVIHNRLAALGFAITLVDDDDAADLTRHLVVISESVTSTSVAAKYKNATMPCVVLESGVWDDMDMSGAATGPAVLSWGTESAHPIAIDYGSSGVDHVMTSAGVTFWAALSGLGTGAQAIWHEAAGATTQITAFVYEAAAAMLASHNAEARRVGIGMQDVGVAAGTADFLNLLDAAIRWAIETAAAGGSLLTRSMAEAVASVDDWLGAGSYSRSLTEGVTQADVVTRQGTFVRTMTEAAAQSDAWTGIKLVVRSWADAVTQNDAWTRAGTFARSLSSSVTQADVWVRAVGFVRSTSGSVTSGDAWTRAGTYLRALTDSVGQADTWAGVKILLRTWTSSVTQADAWSRSAGYVRDLLGSMTQADAWARVVSVQRSLTGAVTQADAWVGIKTGAVIALFTSAVTSSDVWTRTATFGRALTNTVGQADAWLQSRGLVRSLTSAVSQGDSWARSIAYVRALADGVTSSDAWTRVGSFRRSTNEAVGSALAFVVAVIPSIVGGSVNAVVGLRDRVAASSALQRLGATFGLRDATSAGSSLSGSVDATSGERDDVEAGR